MTTDAGLFAPADTLLRAVDDKLRATPDRGAHLPRRVLQTGCAAIDEDVLLGGFERGSVVALTDGTGGPGRAGDGIGRLIAIHTLCHTLLGARRAGRRAAVVDPSGTFPLPLLPRVMRAQLRDSSAGAAAAIKHALARIDVTRVFDIDGLGEVVREIAEADDGGNAGEAAVAPGVGADARDEPADGDREIGDSQDDDDDSPISTDATPEPVPPPANDNRPAVLVVDGFTALVTELFSRVERREAFARLDALSAAMRALAAGHGVVVVLLNGTAKARVAAQDRDGPASDNPDVGGDDGGSAGAQRRVPPPRSVFLANAAVAPALPALMPRFAGLQVLVTSVRRRGTGEASGRGTGRAYVVEVIGDEGGVVMEGEGRGGTARDARGWKTRVERWCAVEAEGQGRGVELMAITGG